MIEGKLVELKQTFEGYSEDGDYINENLNVFIDQIHKTKTIESMSQLCYFIFEARDHIEFLDGIIRQAIDPDKTLGEDGSKPQIITIKGTEYFRYDVAIDVATTTTLEVIPEIFQNKLIKALTVSFEPEASEEF